MSEINGNCLKKNATVLGCYSSVGPGYFTSVFELDGQCLFSSSTKVCFKVVDKIGKTVNVLINNDKCFNNCVYSEIIDVLD